jgi:hypothetical protein
MLDAPAAATRVLVVYCYHERDQVYQDNLRFFLQRTALAAGAKPEGDSAAGAGYDVSYDLVIQGAACGVDLLGAFEALPHARVLRRANEGRDFAGFNHALALRARDGTAATFDRIVFLNSSVRGPFLPPYYGGHWLDPLLGLFASAPDVRLVGTTINVLECAAASPEVTNFWAFLGAQRARALGGRPLTHVQTQVFAIDRECYAFLADQGFFEPRPLPQDVSEYIAATEIYLSYLVLRAAGWNIACLVPEYQGRDYRRVARNFNPYALAGDSGYAGACFGRTLHPYELVFIKTNRGIAEPEIASLTAAAAVRP